MANVPYNPVPTAESTGNLGGGMTQHATPQDFGAQVGEATTKLGDTAFDIAQKQQGMINETAMTNADAQLAMKVGKIKGEYLQNTGDSAVAAFPKYQADLEAARQEARANLPPLAQHGFDMLSMRTIANHIADGSTYMAGQVKAGNIDAGTNLTNVNIQAVLDPNAASDPSRVQWHQDSAIHGLQMQMDENSPGLKKDPETGAVTFDESTPAGKALKANYQAGVDNIITRIQTNRFDTLAKSDVLGAFGIYQQERDGFPRSTQVHLDSVFEPKVFNAHVDNGTTAVLAQAEQEHAKLLYNPDTSGNAINTVLKNEGGMSSDGHAIYGIDKVAHPAEFAKAAAMSPADGIEYAKQFYKTEYWDKKGIADLPANTQNIVMDGVVNHSDAFGNKLVTAAKDGASPQTLIDMRRTEYQRLAIANPEKYGADLAGWNNRLNSLQATNPMTGEKPKNYGTNENGAPLTPADYYRTHSEDVLQRGDAYAQSFMPGDLAFKRATRETLTNYMNKTISNQSAQYVQDNKNLIRAINGEFTKGQPPQTEADLRAVPGVAQLLDKVAAQDPKFAEGIPTMIAKAAHQNTTTNSPNSYDAIQAVLDRSQSHDRQSQIEYLSKGLGSNNPGFSINMKDFNDAKPGIDLDDNSAKILSPIMKEIATANGNIDGKGQERAVQWYNQVMAAKKANDMLGDKKVPDSKFMHDIKDTVPLLAPSRMQQISNQAASAKAMIKMIGPDGTLGNVPAENLQKALALGYKKAG